MVTAIDTIGQYLDGYDYEYFMRDQKTVDAVIRQLEIIGEAANKCGKDFHAQHPEIPWGEIIGTRHRLIHDYAGVMTDVVWGIYQDDLSKLKQQIQSLLP